MATLQKFKNNATTTLAAGIDAVQTSIDVADATALPTITGSEWFYLTITQPTGTTETAWEIVKVTAVAVNTLTVERGQNGTSAQAWSSGSKAENRIVQADAAAFASPYRLSSPDDRSYIEIYDDYTLWSIQDVTVFYSNGVSSTQFYCPGATALTSTGALSIYAASGGLAFQTNVGGDIGFTAGYDPGALPSGVLRMAGQKVEFRGQTMDLIPPFTIGGEPPIQLRFYRAFSSFTSVGFSASMTTDPAADVVWQLPGGDGTANQAMVTDGAGLLSWRTVLSTPAAANMVLTADGLGTFTAATSAELEDGYLTLSGAIGPGIYINGTGSLGGGEIYLSDDGSGSFTGALTASNLSGTNTGDQDLSGLQPLDTQLTALAGLSYAGNAGKYIKVNGTEDGFELATITPTAPGGADTNIQYNDGGSFGGDANLTWNKTTKALTQTGGAYTNIQAVAATSTDGIVLATSATATSGNQKWSPGLRFVGSRYQTAAAAARVVDYRIYLKPIQNAGDWGNDNLIFDYSVNGGAYTEFMRLDGATGALYVGAAKYGYNGITFSDTNSTINCGSVSLSFPSSGTLGLRNNLYYETYQAVATTSTDGLVLATSSAATSSSAIKRSPRARFTTSTWNGSVAKQADFIIEAVPFTDNTVRTNLQFRAYADGVAQNVVLSLTSNGSYGGFVGGMVVTSNADDPYTGSYMTMDTTGIAMKNGAGIGWTDSSNGNGGVKTGFFRNANNDIRQGLADSATPSSQTSSVQNGSGTNIAGALRYYVGSLATGNAVSGGHAFRVGVPGASGTTLQTAETQLTIAYHTATWVDALNFVFGSTTGTKIGTATTQKIGFYNATPIVQPSAITAPAGGATVDAEARTAIGTIISTLQSLGLTA